MKAIQQKLFDEPLKNYGFNPSLEMVCRVMSVFAIENLLGGKTYCYMEEVTIKHFLGDDAIVETTDRYIELLKKANWLNPRKQLYRVLITDLVELKN